MGSKGPSLDLLLALRLTISQPTRCPHLHHRPRIGATARQFSGTPRQQQKRKPKHKNLTKEDMDRIAEQRAAAMKPYTSAEKAALAHKYSPEQMAAIEAGEKAISARDLSSQALLRGDKLIPQYLDDFSRIEHTIDKKIEKLRGEGQDYENVEDFAVFPTAGELAMGMDAETMFDQPARTAEADPARWGEWEKTQDSAGRQKWDFKWDQQQLDKLAEEEFLKTPEGKGLMTRAWAQARADEAFEVTAKAAGMSDEDIAGLDKTIGQPAMQYLEEGGQTFEERILQDSGINVEESGDESTVGGDKPDNATSPSAATELKKSSTSGNLQKPRANTPDSKPSEDSIPDFKSHPRFKTIRSRIAVIKRPSEWDFGTPEAERITERYMQGVLPDVAPDIPKINDPTVKWPAQPGGADGEEVDTTGGLEDEALIAYQRVAKSLGLTVRDLLRFRTKTLVQHRVVNQTRLGKIDSMYVLCVAGNGDGMIGIGEGKAAEPDEAVRIARLNAIRNMVPILRYENRTIYGDIRAKVSAVEVQLGSRRPGFGVRTNAIIFEMARAAGIYDLSARVPRSRNPMNIAKATWEALRSQRDPEMIALGRGQKLVDVRKVYYSGGV